MSCGTTEAAASSVVGRARGCAGGSRGPSSLVNLVNGEVGFLIDFNIYGLHSKGFGDFYARGVERYPGTTTRSLRPTPGFLLSSVSVRSFVASPVPVPTH